jgi:CheY-like chemotaxis protein
LILSTWDRKREVDHGPPQTGQTPAIALTAFAREEDRLRALSAGFHMHMAKPVEPRQLVAAIAYLAHVSQGIDEEPKWRLLAAIGKSSSTRENGQAQYSSEA